MAQHSLGERFGDYKLVRPLGEGGFASVYLGEEVHKGTPAAIKLPKEQQVHDFINELRRTVLLQHPNIIKILDFGIRKPDDTAFIIMEYAPNGSFRDKYPRGTHVPFDVVVPTVKQVASALQYAHDQRVIHRDVKPENLLLNARNMVLLSDFGIATASRTTMTANTGQGDIIGTYAYMAPEQLKGHPVSASDQYSLGIMVYEWLCGELPFEAREYIQWAYLHQEVPPPSLRDREPSLSIAIEQVVLKALAKKPEERFERVEMFALTLEQAVQERDVSSVIHSPQTNTALAVKQANVPSPTPPKTIEQLFQEGVRAQANGNVEEAFRIYQQIIATPNVAEKYSAIARRTIQGLYPQVNELRFKQAREASLQGRWQDEIRLWEDLLKLELPAKDVASLLKSPLLLGKGTNTITQSIQERLKIARQNEQSAWMYEAAQQFIRNKDNAAARYQLQMLWEDAPYYGDPSGLSKDLGLPAALNYEQTLTVEQERLERERLEKARLEKERQEREQQGKARMERERQEREQFQAELMRQQKVRSDQWQQAQAFTRLKRNNIIFIMVSIIVITGFIIEGGVLGGMLGKIIGVIIGGAIGEFVGVGIVWGEMTEELGIAVVEEYVDNVLLIISTLEVTMGGVVTGAMIGGIVGAIAGTVSGAIIGGGAAFAGAYGGLRWEMSITGKILRQTIIGTIAGAIWGGGIMGGGEITIGGIIIGAAVGTVGGIIIGGTITLIFNAIVGSVSRNRNIIKNIRL